MNKENLVVCGEDFVTDLSSFKKGSVYRCIAIGEVENIQLLVYGVAFDIVEFVNRFNYLHNIVTKEWTSMGLIVDGKPLKKTQFKELLSLHRYGRGKEAFYVGYIFNNNPKELIYQIDSPIGGTKANFIKVAYKYYLDVINGDYTPFDDNVIVRGNSGVPISYRKITWR